MSSSYEKRMHASSNTYYVLSLTSFLTSPHLSIFSSFSLFFPDNCFVRSLRRVADGRDGPPLHAILPRARDGGARVEPGRGSIIRRLRSAGCEHRAVAVQAACGARRTTITAETRICFVARPECPAGLSGWMQLHIITVRTVRTVLVFVTI